jgi:hypothetical protein
MILALSYVLAMFLSQLGAMSLDVSTSYPGSKNRQPDVARTISESNFILYDYGIWLEPKKRGRREELARALTNMADPGQ